MLFDLFPIILCNITSFVSCLRLSNIWTLELKSIFQWINHHPITKNIPAASMYKVSTRGVKKSKSKWKLGFHNIFANYGLAKNFFLGTFVQTIVLEF